MLFFRCKTYHVRMRLPKLVKKSVPKAVASYWLKWVLDAAELCSEDRELFVMVDPKQGKKRPEEVKGILD